MTAFQKPGLKPMPKHGLPASILDTAEGRRLAHAPVGGAWRRWGPYLSERQWGTVREDYSRQGDAWDSFPHDHARSRAYRWGKDGKQFYFIDVAQWLRGDPAQPTPPPERVGGRNSDWRHLNNADIVSMPDCLSLASMSARRAWPSTWLGGGEDRHRVGGPYLGNHADGIASMDLSVVPTHSFRLLYGFLVLRHHRRRIMWLAVTANPKAEWIARQVTEACGWEAAPDYVVRNRDCAYGEAFIRRLRAMGIRAQPTAPRSPWQNAYAERLIGSIRREVLDHIVVFGERHLRHPLRSYMTYYNEARTHLSLNKDAPFRAKFKVSAGSSQSLISADCITSTFGSDLR